MATPTVYFVHISDTHIGPTAGYANHGAVALPAAQRLVDQINQLPYKPDFVVHTGDITTHPDPDSYELARSAFSGLRLPIYYVRGNHDSASDIVQYMEMGPREDLTEDQEHLTYAFELNGHRFLVLDTQGPPEYAPQGFLSDKQLRLLQKEAITASLPLTIFLHHPILALDSPWIDANMLVMNGEKVHKALFPARDRYSLRGVFFGHIHQSTQTVRDGVLYVSAASAFEQMTSWPNDEDVQHQYDEPPGFNFVRLSSEQTMIRQHRFPQP